MKINEIFHSIQGESTWAGLPTVFVRLTGCNLRCQYCDTKYSYYEGTPKDQTEILAEIEKFAARYVCITGGEPLLQKDVHPLMRELCDLGYNVSLETSGSLLCDQVDPRVKIILDVKTPDSAEGESFLMKNLEIVNEQTEIKFVICSENDLEWSENFCAQHHLYDRFQILFSPSALEFEPRSLAEKMLAKKSRARLQMQLHKIIWSADARGV